MSDDRLSDYDLKKAMENVYPKPPPPPPGPPWKIIIPMLVGVTILVFIGFWQFSVASRTGSKLETLIEEKRSELAEAAKIAREKKEAQRVIAELEKEVKDVGGEIPKDLDVDGFIAKMKSLVEEAGAELTDVSYDVYPGGNYTMAQIFLFIDGDNVTIPKFWRSRRQIERYVKYVDVDTTILPAKFKMRIYSMNEPKCPVDRISECNKNIKKPLPPFSLMINEELSEYERICEKLEEMRGIRQQYCQVLEKKRLLEVKKEIMKEETE